MALLINRHSYLPITIALINCILFFVAIISFFVRDSLYQPSWIRYILSILIPMLLGYRAKKKKNVDFTGAIAGIMIAASMVLSSYVATISLITCYLATSKATRSGGEIKGQFEPNYQKDGQRNWIQIFCNLGFANIVILLRLIWFGAGEIRLDFIHEKNYWNSWLMLSSLMSLSAALGDTFSSELGPVFSGPNNQPLLITTLRRVPTGTNGGVTINGFVAACIGGLVIGLSSYLSILFFTFTGISVVSRGHLQSTPQWPLLHFCLYSGLLGSILDSFLGATLQYTGYDHRRRRIVETIEQHNDDYSSSNQQQLMDIEHITGWDVLDNHEVNLLMTTTMGFVMPFIATLLWPFGFGDEF